MKRAEEASNRRRNVLKSLLAIGALCALGGVAVRATRLRAPRPSRTPWLRIHEGGTSVGPKESPVLWLALAALSPSRRSPLLDELEAAAASIEARANPLLVDFVEDDVESVFRRSQSWLLPICTAASALLASSYEAPDGFSVEALPVDSPRLPGDVPAWKRGQTDARERRARFLAWPASRSVVLRGANEERRRRLEADLRGACASPDSAVALVVDPLLLRGTSPEPRIGALLTRFEKGQRRLAGNGDVPLLPTIPPPGFPLSRWVVLEPGELLVVPKLAALSPPTRFESEIRARLRETEGELVE